MFYTHERNFGCRVNDELTYRGLRMMTLENELIKISILLDKGADIFEFVYKPLDLDFLWRTPLGVRPFANNHDMIANSVGPFMDYFEGGWQECMPNGGRVCNYKGVDMGLHGEVWGIPWKHEILEDSPSEVSVRLWCRTSRSPYFLQKTLTLKSDCPVLHIEEALTNEGSTPLDLMWGHHPSFGPPFLDDSCVLNCTAQRVVVDKGVDDASRLPAGAEFAWPVGTTKDGQPWDISRVPAPEERVTEMTYLTDLTDGWYTVINQRRKVGFGMAFDTSVFKHLWCWQCFGGDMNYPSWGRYYAMAVEPFSGYPAILSRAIEAGHELVIGPGETRTSWLRAVAFTGLEQVNGIDASGTIL